MIRSSEPAPILVSGASAMPRRRLQRLRARISVEEMVDVERHRRRRLAGQHLLEMPPRQLVLALEEEGAGEFEADADEARGARTSMAWKAAIASSSSASRCLRPNIPASLRCLDRREPSMNSTLSSFRAGRASGRSTVKRLLELALLPDQAFRASAVSVAAADEAGGFGAPRGQGRIWRRRRQTTASARNRGTTTDIGSSRHSVLGTSGDKKKTPAQGRPESELRGKYPLIERLLTCGADTPRAPMPVRKVHPRLRLPDGAVFSTAKPMLYRRRWYRATGTCPTPALRRQPVSRLEREQAAFAMAAPVALPPVLELALDQLADAV